jgi:adenylate cyclase
MPVTTGEGAEDLRGATLLNGLNRQLNWVSMIGNGLGGGLIFVFLVFLFPSTVDEDEFGDILALNLPVFLVYMALTLPLGRLWFVRRFFEPLRAWLASDRPAGETERELVLGYPARVSAVAGFFWAVAAVLFGLLNLGAGVDAAASIGATVLLGGLSACALQYLLVERALRPVTALALAGGRASRLAGPGVAARLTMAWTLATGVPLFGLAALAMADVAGAEVDRDQLVLATLFLALVAIVIGLGGMYVAARSIADPLAAMRNALEGVEQGEFGTRVPVDDGSEVGLLQAGFNQMSAGLDERERMRDLFGRHVGPEVAKAALDGSIRLGGEVREIAALFIDLVGSTTMAAERPPTEVVALLNDFFLIVVDGVEAHGGLVNKFEGDAALAVFGAPVAAESPAADALAAAREISERLALELSQLEAGIGVSAGEAVAGNVGAERRFEYTVIGDPVNEAARLCELAKERPERVLASEAALVSADAREREHWALGETITVRGRSAPTRLAVPVAPLSGADVSTSPSSR